ncbi:MAG: DUF4340 domain-containing protein [Verrucomicrobiota bacterium]
MSPRITIILVLLATALLCYLYFFEKDSAGTQEKKERHERVFPITGSGTISRIDVTNQYGGFSFIREARNAWLIERPVDYPASRLAMDALLSEIDFARRMTTLDKEQLIDYAKALEEYGLSAASYKIKVISNNQFYELSIGKETAREGHFYALVTSKKSEDVIVISKTLLDRVNKDLDQWRSRSIFDINSDFIQALTLKDEGQELTISKIQNNWRVDRPLAIEADDLKVKEYLSALNAAKIESFLSQEKGQAVDAGLTAAKLALQIEDHQGAKQILWIGNSVPEMEELLYAKLEGNDLIFTVHVNFMDMVTGLLDKVRDRRLLPIDDIRNIYQVKMELEGQVAFELKREEESSNWWVENIASTAERSEVIKWLKSLRKIQALEFHEPGLGQGVIAESILTIVSKEEEGWVDSVIEFSVEQNLLVRAWNTSMPYSVSIGSDFMNAYLNKRSWNFLSKGLIDQSENNWQSITWRVRGDVNKLVKIDEFWKSERGEIDNDALQYVLDRLVHLKARSWLGPVDKKLFEDSETIIEIAFKNDEVMVLRIGKTIQNGMVMCSIEGNPFAFAITSGLRSDLEKYPIKQVEYQP